MRTVKSKEKIEDDNIEREIGNEEASSSGSIMSSNDEKPRKKKNYRKPKSKFAESYPSYIQVFIEYNFVIIFFFKLLIQKHLLFFCY